MTAPAPQNRARTGSTATQFKPGQPSANPGGRPKGFARVVRDICGGDGQALAAMLHQAADTGYITYTHPETQKVTYEKVGVNDRHTAVRMLLERGWGKPPMYAPIEDDDPLDLANRQAEEIADSFDTRMDELAARRQQADAA